jgi:hypothetical protein
MFHWNKNQECAVGKIRISALGRGCVKTSYRNDNEHFRVAAGPRVESFEWDRLRGERIVA